MYEFLDHVIKITNMKSITPFSEEDQVCESFICYIYESGGRDVGACSIRWYYRNRTGFQFTSHRNALN